MLDNNGWGLGSMILLSTIILIALFTATFYAIALYSQLDNSIKIYEESSNNDEKNEDEQEEPVMGNEDVSKTINYFNYEKQLKEGALAYARDCNCFAGAEFVRVELIELLKLSYIEPMEDIDKSLCTGYVDVYPQDDDSYLANAYLMCNNYITEGYNE